MASELSGSSWSVRQTNRDLARLGFAYVMLRNVINGSLPDDLREALNARSWDLHDTTDKGLEDSRRELVGLLVAEFPDAPAQARERLTEILLNPPYADRPGNLMRGFPYIELPAVDAVVDTIDVLRRVLYTAQAGRDAQAVADAVVDVLLRGGWLTDDGASSPVSEQLKEDMARFVARASGPEPVDEATRMAVYASAGPTVYAWRLEAAVGIDRARRKRLAAAMKAAVRALPVEGPPKYGAEPVPESRVQAGRRIAKARAEHAAHHKAFVALVNRTRRMGATAAAFQVLADRPGKLSDDVRRYLGEAGERLRQEVDNDLVTEIPDAALQVIRDGLMTFPARRDLRGLPIEGPTPEALEILDREVAPALRGGTPVPRDPVLFSKAPSFGPFGHDVTAASAPAKAAADVVEALLLEHGTNVPPERAVSALERALVDGGLVLPPLPDPFRPDGNLMPSVAAHVSPPATRSRDWPHAIGYVVAETDVMRMWSGVRNSPWSVNPAGFLRNLAVPSEGTLAALRLPGMQLPGAAVQAPPPAGPSRAAAPAARDSALPLSKDPASGT